MWGIFRGAYITICASSSTSCQARFLEDRNLRPGLEVQLREVTEWFVSPDSPSTCKIIPSTENTLHRSDETPYDDPFLHEVCNSVWHSRGWVHQEIAFSQRLLIFGTDFIFFSCPEFQACENGWRSLRNLDPGLTPTRTAACGILESDLQQKPFLTFARDVTQFCDKELTFETDCLPAMAGLASQVAKLTGSEPGTYLAGLWRDNLAHDLLFSVRSSSRSQLCPFDARLRELSDPGFTSARPSWSWVGHRDSFKAGASLFHLYLSPGLDIDCEMLQSVAIPVGKNPFGQVKRAYLVIRCRMITVKKLLGFKPGNYHLTALRRLPGLYSWWDTNNADACRSLSLTISLACISKAHDGRVAGLFVYPTGKEGEYFRVGMWFEIEANKASRASGFSQNWPTQTIKLV